MLKFIHSNLKIHLGESYYFTSKGVPQGLTTSPILFNIYVEELMNELRGKGLFFQLFADDIVIACDNRNELIESIILVEEWCNEFNMKLNKNKCGIMVIGKKTNKNS